MNTPTLTEPAPTTPPAPPVPTEVKSVSDLTALVNNATPAGTFIPSVTADGILMLVPSGFRIDAETGAFTEQFSTEGVTFRFTATVSIEFEHDMEGYLLEDYLFPSQYEVSDTLSYHLPEFESLDRMDTIMVDDVSVNVSMTHDFIYVFPAAVLDLDDAYDTEEEAYEAACDAAVSRIEQGGKGMYAYAYPTVDAIEVDEVF